MNINDVADVVIDHNSGRKFIVAELFDSVGRKKTVVRVGDAQYFSIRSHHDNIIEKLKREVDSLALRVHCLGGGRIEIDSASNCILVRNDCEGFEAEPCREQTIRMLQKMFPNHTISSYKH